MTAFALSILLLAAGPPLPAELEVRPSELEALLAAKRDLSPVRKLNLLAVCSGAADLSFPPAGVDLSRLEVLGFSMPPGRQDCDLRVALGPGLGALTGLREFGVDEALQGPLPAELGKLVNLTRLTLCREGLVELPALVRSLKKLQHLDLSWNRLENLPEWLGELPRLESIRLGGNEIRMLPVALTRMRTVKRLGLSSNGLNLRQQKAIRALLPGVAIDFENGLDEPGTPNEVVCDEHEDKCVLDASYWPLLIDARAKWSLDGDELTVRADCRPSPVLVFPPPGVGLGTSFTVLRLGAGTWKKPTAASCRLRLRLLPGLGKLERLSVLELDGTLGPGEALPEDVAGLRQLQILTLAGMGLREVPAFVRELERLQFLDLRRNQLAALPDWLGHQRQELSRLGLVGNRITRIPAAVANNPNLREVLLGNNGLTLAAQRALRASVPAAVALDFSNEEGLGSPNEPAR